MLGGVHPNDARIDARTLPIFSNHTTRCSACQGTGAIRVSYHPGCRTVAGDHFRRDCPCGHSWGERTAGHTACDITSGDPRWVLLCQHCGTRLPDKPYPPPRCCRLPELDFHDTTEPCELCTTEREPGQEG